MPQPVRKVIQKILKQEIAAVFKAGRLWKRCRQFILCNWITITTIILSVILCSLMLYMLLSGLPKVPVPDFSGDDPLTSDIGQVRDMAPLATYLKPLKTRDLFKPSIPIPAEKKIGKTTAQQLAGRLQFLGTSGDEHRLWALVFIPERGPGSFQIGDRVAEFVLKDIATDRLVLELENEQVILKR